MSNRAEENIFDDLFSGLSFHSFWFVCYGVDTGGFSLGKELKKQNHLCTQSPEGRTCSDLE